MKSQSASAAVMSNTPATGVTVPTDGTERFAAGNRSDANPEGQARPVIDELASRAHETIGRVSERAVRTEQELRDNVAKAEAQLRAFKSNAQSTADEQVAELKSFVEQKPLQSAGIALLAGFILSRVLR